MRRVLFVSNGHGEDAVACKVLDRVRTIRTDGVALELSAWPMVGRGSAYVRRSVPIVGAPNRLPSEGFATLDARLLARDLRAGWLQTHWRQFEAARALRGRYDLIVAVGDVVPMGVARLSRTPFVFIGCAKSEYYGPGYGYTWLELRWLRRCRLAFPRDELTVATLRRAGVRVAFAGNPMMDDLTERGLRLVDAKDVAITCLPGSRADSVDNALHLLKLVPHANPDHSMKGRMHYLFVLAPDFDLPALTHHVVALQPREGAGPSEWVLEPTRDGDPVAGIRLRLSTRDRNATATFVFDALVDAVAQSQLVIGLAGTANEQAVGLGKPLIVLAGSGNQGRAYTRMKMRYFGEAATYCDGDQQSLQHVMSMLLTDGSRRQRMISAGKERMGKAGASDVIARHVYEYASVPTPLI